MSFPRTKATVRESLEDIAQGSMGHCKIDFSEGDDNPVGLLGSMGVEDWFRYIAAIRRRYDGLLLPPVFELYNLHHFETISGAVDLLWRCRA